jgi:16S rRNA (guanine966-N2)-methyltransferase
LAGEFKGKRLKLPSLDVTRSSKSRLKESYFNRIQFDIIDHVFVELFAGSGSVGLEALSRGAKQVYFFEKDKNSFNILKQNIQITNPSKCVAQQGNSFELAPKLFQTLEKTHQKAYFFLDPPFSYRDGMEKIYDLTLDLIKQIPPSIVEMITIEHMSDLKLPHVIGEFTLEKQKKFGKTTLSYYMI